MIGQKEISTSNISLIVIGLKNSYFPLIHLPSCYQTVCYQGVTVIGQFAIGHHNP